jgi:hypothetical protein
VSESISVRFETLLVVSSVSVDVADNEREGDANSVREDVTRTDSESDGFGFDKVNDPDNAPDALRDSVGLSPDTVIDAERIWDTVPVVVALSNEALPETVVEFLMRETLSVHIVESLDDALTVTVLLRWHRGPAYPSLQTHPHDPTPSASLPITLKVPTVTQYFVWLQLHDGGLPHIGSHVHRQLGRIPATVTA